MALNKNKVIAAAQRYAQKGQLDRAISELRTIVDEDPEDVRIWHRIADLQIRKGSVNQAISTYHRIARHYEERGFFLKGVAVYKQILSADPTLVDVHRQLGELYVKLGLGPEAIGQFQIVVGTYEREGRHADSLELLEKIVELGPDDESNRIRLAEGYARQSHNDRAIAEFKHTLHDLRDKARYEDYVQVAERLLYLYPDELDVVRALSEVYLERGDPKRALARLQILFRADPTDPLTLDLLARAFTEIGQTAKAVSVYRELARVHGESGDTTGQREAWVSLLDLDPNDPEALAATGGVASDAPLRTSGAQSVAGLADERRGESVERHLTDVDLLLKYELRDHARERLQLALALDPLNEAALLKQRDLAVADDRVDDAVGALMRLADAAEQGSDPQKAMKWLGEVLQLRPGDPDAAERLRRMSSGMARQLASSAEPVEHDAEPDVGADYDVDLGEIDFDGGMDDDLPVGGFALDLDALDASVDDEFADLLDDEPPAPPAGVLVPDAPPGVIVPDAPADDAFGDLLADDPLPADDAFGDLLADDAPPADDAFGDLLADAPDAPADDAFGDLLADAPDAPTDDAFGDLLVDAPPPPNDDAFGDLLADAPPPPNDDAFGDLLADEPPADDNAFGDLLVASVEAPGSVPVIVPSADDEPLVDGDDLGGLDLDAPADDGLADLDLDLDAPADDGLGDLDLDAPADDAFADDGFADDGFADDGLGALDLDPPTDDGLGALDLDPPADDGPADDGLGALDLDPPADDGLGALDLDPPADEDAGEVGFMTELPPPEALPDDDEFADLLLEGSGSAAEPDFGVYRSSDDLPLTPPPGRLPPLSDAPAEIDIDIDVSENMPEVDLDYGAEDDDDLSIDLPASIAELPPPPPPPSSRRAAQPTPPVTPPAADDEEIEELDLDEIDIIELDDDDLVLEDDGADPIVPPAPPTPPAPPAPPAFDPPAESTPDPLDLIAGFDAESAFGDAAASSDDDGPDDDATVVAGVGFDLGDLDLGGDTPESATAPPAEPDAVAPDAPALDDHLPDISAPDISAPDISAPSTDDVTPDVIAGAADESDFAADAPVAEDASDTIGIAPITADAPSDEPLADDAAAGEAEHDEVDGITDDGIAHDGIIHDGITHDGISGDPSPADAIERADEGQGATADVSADDTIDSDGTGGVSPDALLADGDGTPADGIAAADGVAAADAADDAGDAGDDIAPEAADTDATPDERPSSAVEVDAIDASPADVAPDTEPPAEAPPASPPSPSRPVPRPPSPLPRSPAASVADRLNALRPKRAPAPPKPLTASGLSLRSGPPAPPAPLPGASPVTPARQALLRPPQSSAPAPSAQSDAEPPIDDRTEAGGLSTDEPALLSPPDDVPADLSEELAELDFLIEGELADEADELLRELEAAHPAHPALAARRARLESARAAEPGIGGDVGGDGDGDGDVFDADSLLSGLDDDFDFDFSEVQGAELADIRDDEADTHFDLGLAFREMGQHQKAIAELELAARSPDKRLDAQRIIALCHLDAGDAAAAVTVLRDALSAAGLDASASAPLRYDLATALEQLGDPAGARAELEAIAAAGLPDFLDLRARLDALGG